MTNQDSGRCFNAGVDLPNSAKITSVTVYLTESSNAMYFELNRQDLANHTDVMIVSFDSPIATSPTYTSIVTKMTANNVVTTKDAYSFGVCPSGTTTFSGATVAYSG